MFYELWNSIQRVEDYLNEGLAALLSRVLRLEKCSISTMQVVTRQCDNTNTLTEVCVKLSAQLNSVTAQVAKLTQQVNALNAERADLTRTDTQPLPDGE